MDVKAAVQVAMQYVLDLFRDEGIRDLGLEEVSLDEDNKTWQITLGFARPWDEQKVSLVSSGVFAKPRAYKTVRIADATGNVIGKSL